MGPRGMGRGRGPPPRPGMMGGPRPGRGLRPGQNPVVSTAAPSWMSSAVKPDNDDGDFAQPVPVSKLISAPKAETLPAPEEPVSKSGTCKPAPVASSMPPWAKPYKGKTEEPASTGSDGATTSQRRCSLGGGMPKWGPKTAPPAAADSKPSEDTTPPR